MTDKNSSMNEMIGKEIRLLLGDLERVSDFINEIGEIVENSSAYWDGDAADEFRDRMTEIADDSYHLTNHMKKALSDQLQKYTYIVSQ